MRTIVSAKKRISTVPESIEIGGTGASTAQTALEALGGVAVSQLNVTDGIAQLDSNRFVKPENIPLLNTVDTPMVVIPKNTIAIGESIDCVITNYDTYRTYTFTDIVSGTAALHTYDDMVGYLESHGYYNVNSLVIPDIIQSSSSPNLKPPGTVVYTAPGVPGPGGFSINGKHYNITITPPVVPKPVIASPVNNAVNSKATISVNANLFTQYALGDPTECNFQIAEDANFTLGVVNVTFNNTGLTATHIFDQLATNKLYYIRTRVGCIDQQLNTIWSEWSDVVSFATSAKFDLQETQILVPVENTTDILNYSGLHVNISKDGSVAIMGTHEAKLIGDENANNLGSITIFQKDLAGNFAYQISIHNPAETQEQISFVSRGRFGLSTAIASDNQTIFVAAGNARKLNSYLNDSLIYVYKTTVANDYTTLALVQILEPTGDFGCMMDWNYQSDKQLMLTSNDEYLFAAYGRSQEDPDALTLIAPMGCVVIYKKVNGDYQYDSYINNPALVTYRAGDTLNYNIYFAQALSISDDGNTLMIANSAAHDSIQGSDYIADIYEKQNSVWVKTLSLGYDTYPALQWQAGYAISPDGNTAIATSNFATTTTNGVVCVAIRTLSGWQTLPFVTLSELMSGLVPNIDQYGHSRGWRNTIQQVVFDPTGQYVYLAAANVTHQDRFYTDGEGDYDGCVIKCSILNGVLTPIQYLFASDYLDSTYGVSFGWSINTSDVGLIVGSWSSKNSSNPHIHGEAYIFE